MFNSSVSLLRCPKRKKANTLCGGKLAGLASNSAASADILSGQLECERCKAKFPILGGVAVLVQDVRQYLIEHAKGISQLVADSEIPKEFRKDYLAAKAEIQVEHIEEDLEAERVNALYLMNHYLHVQGPLGEWWKPTSPVIDRLVRDYWDHGPFAQIENWAAKIKPAQKIVELGCGVGGLCAIFARNRSEFYLGIDSSFASIALARHLNLGAPYRSTIRIPGDLLQGPVSRKIEIKNTGMTSKQADFVVGDLEAVPAENGAWNGVVTLNAIDMLEDPTVLPKIQHTLLAPGGFVVQSCPYIWHELVAKELRARIPKDIQDSARAIEWLYEKNGFKVTEKIDHLPWLFFKHYRQLEVYSVHIFLAVSQTS